MLKNGESYLRLRIIIEGSFTRVALSRMISGAMMKKWTDALSHSLRIFREGFTRIANQKCPSEKGDEDVAEQAILPAGEPQLGLKCPFESIIIKYY